MLHTPPLKVQILHQNSHILSYVYIIVTSVSDVSHISSIVWGFCLKFILVSQRATKILKFSMP